MLKKILYLALILGVIGGGYGYYIWNKPPVKTSDKSTDITISANDLAAQYDDAKYLGKVVQVKGKVTSISTENGITNVSIETNNPMISISCEMEKGTATPSVKEGEELTLKGQCDGKLTDIGMSRCIEVK